MAGTNQIASETWVPQTDKFGNQVNPVWAQNGGTGTAEQVSQYNTMIRDLATRALSTSGAGADAFNFAGYTLPNNKYVQQALQGWTPPETKILDPISGRLTSTTQLSYADALAKLGVTPGTTSTYTADKTFAPNDAMAGFSQDQKNALAGSFSDIGNQKNNASYISSPLVNKTIPVTSDPSPGARSLISDVPKTGYIKGYDTNNGYKQVYVPAGKYVPGISLYPKPTNTITPDKMRNETPINVPGTATNGSSPVGAGEANAMIAGGKTALSDLIQQLTPTQTDAEKKQQMLLDQMASLAGQEANRAADQLTAEQSANLPQLRQQFAEINGQIMTKSAEYDALVKAQEGKPITMSSIIGSERAILNAKASDIGMLTARAQALQGQIETAQSTVNRSIDLKYSSIDARLNMYQAQLNALQPTLTKEEKIRAQAQQILLDERKQVLEEQKNTEKQLSNYNIEMMSKYPSAKISITDSYETTQKKVTQSEEYIAEKNKDSYGSGMIGEYQFYVDQEKKAGRTPMSFTDYQNEDANRKRLASTIANSSGLTPQQTSTLMNITNNYQKDALVQAFDKGQGLNAIADQVLANPNSATNQLKSLYSFVKNLDPDSAVREGEVALANQTNSYLDRFKTSLMQVAQGQVISPSAAKELALATKELVSGWESGVNARKTRYTAQAQQLGVGDAFNQYLQSSSSLGGSNNNDPLGLGISSNGGASDPLSLGFNGLGSGSGNAQEFDAMRFAAAIGQFESGGKYSAIGPDTGNGNRALGRYQVMASNVPSWTKEALGYSLTPEQFLKDQKAQDAVAQYKMAQYYEKHKNLADVASIWFSGRPVSKAGNAKDVIGTSVPQYVKNVLAIYNRNA